MALVFNCNLWAFGSFGTDLVLDFAAHDDAIG